MVSSQGLGHCSEDFVRLLLTSALPCIYWFLGMMASAGLACLVEHTVIRLNATEFITAGQWLRRVSRGEAIASPVKGEL